jgi:F-type H+-transporting ATPase subunit delta
VKSEQELVAAQYAQAVLELAVQSKTAELDEIIASDLSGISQIMQQNPDLNLLLGNPSVPAEDKRALLIKLFAMKANDLTVRLLELLNDKRRLELLPKIATQYQVLLKERKQIVTAKLVCSDPLNEKSLADIKARLTEHLGEKLDLEVSVDPSLIGGFLLRLGDQVIDGSIRAKLREIEKTLLSV